MIAKMTEMKKKNLSITFSILFGFCIAAYTANITIDYNYMFLMAGDGTPYDILYNLFQGNRVLYPLSVIALFVIYIVVFYYFFHLIKKKNNPTIAEEKQPVLTKYCAGNNKANLRCSTGIFCKKTH
jgi:hypothetical protein